MTRIVLVLLCLAGTFILSCDSSTDPVAPAPFSLRIEIADPAGKPVEGLRVSGWNDIKGYGPFLSRVGRAPTRPAATTGIRFATPVKSVVNLSVFDFDNHFIATLVDTVMRAGGYVVAWGPDGSVPPGIYRCRMIAADTLSGQTLFDETIYPVKHEFDPDRAVLGFTDDEGAFATTNRLLFPYVLAGKPELLLIGLDADTLGILEYDDIATIVVTDTSTGQSQIEQVDLSKNATRASIIWAPRMGIGVAGAPSDPISHPCLAADADVPRPPLTWIFGPNYPNPFN